MVRLGLFLSLGIFLLPTPAQACGGCFHQVGPITSQTSTVVTGHRMAFAVSETQTVLWDQFSYEGEAAEFSWVLPVQPDAYLELSDDAWLEALDSSTQMNVVSPTLECAQPKFSSGSGCGCGSSDSATSASGNVDPNGSGGFAGKGGVTIIRHETVGPYETDVVQSQDPNALHDWLVNNGYVIPDEIQPIIDAYVSEGMDFLALKLRPGFGVQQMEPVRVITPGGAYLLPLRMVAAGIGSFVEVKLFVIAGARYAMPDLAEVRVNPKDVVYDFATSSSNYLTARNAALAQNSGKSYVVTSAQIENGGLCGGFSCGDQNDLEAALLGMNPSGVWLTRLELNLPATALDHDCIVEPALSQTPVSATITAGQYKNPPCDEALFSADVGGTGFGVWALLTFCARWLVRRREARA
ncbi:MAG TPA: DUF2330 domain-containing protein [Polyangiaceae bacterium]|nr:DUF2330 domain-containing protein [Polyangiaceae bacterium]